MMRDLAAIFEEAETTGLKFLVIGGLAVISHGHSRSTFDADLAVRRSELGEWKQLLFKFGFAVRHEQDTFVQFAPPLVGMWPVDLMLLNDGTFDLLYSDAQPASIAGRSCRIPALERLIAMKLHALKHGTVGRRDQDMGDVVELMQIGHIDPASRSFGALCVKYGTGEIHDEIRTRLKR